MQSLLVLYASAKITAGGLGWSDAAALRLVGYYGALVYVSPIIGGLIADRMIGRKLAVFFGAIIMMCGHAVLAFHGETPMYIGLALLISGCGLLKPAISAMVGEFFTHKETSRKDASYAFILAAFGLLIGIINFLITRNHSLRHVGNVVDKTKQVKTPWTKNEKTKATVYILLCISNIFWNVIYVLPYGLLTLYAEKNIDRHVGGFQIPSTWFFGMYGLLIIIYSPIVATLYQKYRQRTGKDMTLSFKLSMGYLLVALGSLILLPLVKAIGANSSYIGSAWYIIGFYSLFSFSELLTLPVMLAAATTFAPKNFSATMVSLNMAISWAIGAWLGGEFGAMTEQTNPATLFWWVIALSIVFAIGHLLTNKKIEQTLLLD